MKKTYQQPATVVMTVSTESNMLSGSLQVNGTTSNPEDLLSRRRNNNSVWDDEEDY